MHQSTPLALVLLASCALVALGGCPADTTPNQTVPPEDTPAARLFVGTFDTSVAPDGLNVFKIDVPADRELEVIADPGDGATLGIGFAEAPDGATFFSTPGATQTSADGRFSVAPRSAASGGTGFRFVGQAPIDGTWRFSIAAEASVEVLQACLAERSLLENLPINLWLMLGQPDWGDGFRQMLAEVCPEFAGTGDRRPVVVTVDLIEPGGGSGGTGGGDSTITPAPTRIELTRIVQTGDAVPGQPNATFKYFSNPIIDRDGRVAFFASYTGGGGDGGLYVFNGSALVRVFDTDPAGASGVPGGGPDEVFGGFTLTWDGGSPTMAWGHDGRLIFAAHVNGSGMPDGLYRWRASDGNLLLLSNVETFRALFSNAGQDFLPAFYFPGLSDTGIVHFVGRYSFFDTDGAFVFFNSGLFTTNGVRLRARVAQQITDLSVPGQAGASFAGFELIDTHNTSGDVLIQGRYTGGQGDRGIYRWDGQSLTRVLDNAPGGAPVGLPAGATVGTSNTPFDAMALGERGQIAINAPLTINNDTNTEVIYFDGSRWSRVLVGTQRAGFLLSGVNRRGQIVFRAAGTPYLGDAQQSTRIDTPLPGELGSSTLRWLPFGAAINNQNRALLRYQHSDTDADGLALWNGSRLLLVADLQLGTPRKWDAIFPTAAVPLDDQIVRAGNVTGRPEVDRPDLTGVLNDRDELVFRIGSLGQDNTADTNDDRQAIYICRGQP